MSLFQSPQTTTPRKQIKKVAKTQPQSVNTFFLLLLFLYSQISFSDGVSILDLNSVETTELDVMGKMVCTGKIGECAELGAEEEEMDSESNRRVLMVRKYISYETLKRDMVPCTKPGASYYNCRGAGQTNSYGRGCEVITRCARDVSGNKS